MELMFTIRWSLICQAIGLAKSKVDVDVFLCCPDSLRVMGKSRFCIPRLFNHLFQALNNALAPPSLMSKLFMIDEMNNSHLFDHM